MFARYRISWFEHILSLVNDNMRSYSFQRMLRESRYDDEWKTIINMGDGFVEVLQPIDTLF